MVSISKSEISRRYRARHKARVLEIARKYRDSHRQQVRDYRRRYYKKHSKRVYSYAKRYAQRNAEKVRLRIRRYRKLNEATIRLQRKNYQIKHRKKTMQRRRVLYATDPQTRLQVLLRSQLWRALSGQSKSRSTLQLLGCSVSYLKDHLEKQFQPGMSWTRRGEWHIDHIKPCASFDLSRPSEQRRCFNYKNLQPLWKIDNLRKGARGSGDQHAC